MIGERYLRLRPVRLLVAAVALAACDGAAREGDAIAGSAEALPASSTATITLDTSTVYQTIVGWEAHAHAGEGEIPEFPQYADRLVDMAAYEIGINRIRLQLLSGAENPTDRVGQLRAGTISYDQFRCPRWETINDNADPDSIDPRGFHFTQVDEMVQNVIIPLQRRLAARGEKVYVNLTYTAFLPYCSGKPYVHEDPKEYAELILATFLHMRDRYGFVPDGVNIILEPDNTEYWTGRRIGVAITTTARVLAAHGFTPEFIGPSISRVSRAKEFMEPMLSTRGVLRHLKELSYHRYGRNSEENLRGILELARKRGLRTAMLERTGGDYHALHADLKIANVSAWEQFAIAVQGDGRAGNVLIGVEPKAVPPRVFLAARTKYLLHYFRYIRSGARRVEAKSTSSLLDPVAFINANGSFIVVVKAGGQATFTINGLPPGRYGLVYTTEAESGVELPGVDASPEGAVTGSIPAAGVITVYARSALPDTSTVQ